MSQANLLKTISLPELSNWSVRYLLEFTFNYNEDFQLVSIGEFLTRNRNVIAIQDETTYSRVTVRGNNNGVRLRDTAMGKNIGTKKQYLVNSGQFIISKIDARNGAMGIIPTDLEGAIVTSDFPTFTVDSTRINPQFLLLITTTKTFINFAQSCSSGTTNRQRINIEQFLNIKIPLPSLKEQDKIVTQYYEKVALAEMLNNNALELEQEIEDYLFEVLGIEKADDKVSKKGLQFVALSQLDKWGVDFIENNSNKSALYKEYRINEVCKISSGGTPLRSRKEYYSNGDIPWIKTGELGNAIIFDSEEKITAEGLKNSSAKLYEKGSLVIAMYGATIGKTAKLGISASTNQACAVLTNINNDVILTDFLWEYLQVQIDSLKKLAYGSAQPNLNAGIISNYKIPIPSLSTQRKIISHILHLKNKIRDLKNEAEHTSVLAISEFEQEIFKPV